MKSWYLGLLMVFPALPASAGAVEQLRAFLQETKTATADFSQTVTGRSARQAQNASGNMAFARPGKFRWVYDKPYDQLIVGDGEKLWVYDKDLNQVTVKRLGQALGASPAALLAGANDLEENFELRNVGSRDGLEWVEATPKAADGTFERVRIGFSGNLPQVMELSDNFGQVTTLSFARFERNPKLDARQFRFSPPKDADLVGE